MREDWELRAPSSLQRAKLLARERIFKKIPGRSENRGYTPDTRSGGKEERKGPKKRKGAKGEIKTFFDFFFASWRTWRLCVRSSLLANVGRVPVPLGAGQSGGRFSRTP
jgi:hypothetical protein